MGKRRPKLLKIDVAKAEEVAGPAVPLPHTGGEEEKKCLAAEQRVYSQVDAHVLISGKLH
jgi:hypothetical protein